MRHYHCHCCSQTFDETKAVFPHGSAHAGKAGGFVTGLAIGAATKNGWAALITALALGIAGTIVDETVTPKCPTCGALLKVVLRAAAG